MHPDSTASCTREAPSGCTRRTFVTRSVSCAAHIAAAASASSLLARRAWASIPFGGVVASEPFGRLEQLAEGIWALVSTPLSGDNTTVANGGIVAGRDGVLVIEGLMTPLGAQWLAGKAKELAGRLPTHAVVTHYHADHANGLAGYSSGSAPVAHVSAVTRELVLSKNLPTEPNRTRVFGDAVVVDAERPSTLDLGGRRITLVPRRGHTASDLTIEVEEPSVVFGGDLVWNGMFPNYVDAVPSQLSASVAALRRSRDTRYVPGHGGVASSDDLARYVAVLDEVEHAARRAVAAGTPAATAAASFRLSQSLGEWLMFSPTFMPRAFVAWERELRAR